MDPVRAQPLCGGRKQSQCVDPRYQCKAYKILCLLICRDIVRDRRLCIPSAYGCRGCRQRYSGRNAGDCIQYHRWDFIDRWSWKRDWNAFWDAIIKDHNEHSYSIGAYQAVLSKHHHRPYAMLLYSASKRDPCSTGKRRD